MSFSYKTYNYLIELIIILSTWTQEYTCYHYIAQENNNAIAWCIVSEKFHCTFMRKWKCKKHMMFSHSHLKGLRDIQGWIIWGLLYIHPFQTLSSLVMKLFRQESTEKSCLYFSASKLISSLTMHTQIQV